MVVLLLAAPFVPRLGCRAWSLIELVQGVSARQRRRHLISCLINVIVQFARTGGRREEVEAKGLPNAAIKVRVDGQ